MIYRKIERFLKPLLDEDEYPVVFGLLICIVISPLWFPYLETLIKEKLGEFDVFWDNPRKYGVPEEICKAADRAKIKAEDLLISAMREAAKSAIEAVKLEEKFTGMGLRWKPKVSGWNAARSEMEKKAREFMGG